MSLGLGGGRGKREKQENGHERAQLIERREGGGTGVCLSHWCSSINLNKLVYDFHVKVLQVA